MIGNTRFARQVTFGKGKSVIHAKVICIIIFVLAFCGIAFAGEPEDPGAINTLPGALDAANADLIQILYFGAPMTLRGAGLAAPSRQVGSLSILDAQSQYYAAHGKYWQGLPTHSIIPAAGDPLPPDAITAHPSDQVDTWLDVGIYLSNDMDVSLAIDSYQSPTGYGYVVRASTRITDFVWSRAINIGPETTYTMEWSPFVSPLEAP